MELREPGDQFEVLKVDSERAWIERGIHTGWVDRSDLRFCTQVIPPV